jgi:hypothetical protein
MSHYAHVAPDGSRASFSAEDDALIAGAAERGEPSVRLSDVRLANGKILRFEVRFGANARSRRMPRGSPTGMCQVNLDNENTRIVEEIAGAQRATPQPAAATAPAPAPAPAAASAPQFAHVAPTGARVNFSAEDSALIADAIEHSASAVRLGDVRLPNGAVLRFEVRFGANARSRRMQGGSPSGMCQVNLDNENTRMVERVTGPTTTGLPLQVACSLALLASVATAS